jgi:hypothetical protein
MNLTTVEACMGIMLLILLVLGWAYSAIREEWRKDSESTFKVYYDLSGRWELIPWHDYYGVLTVPSHTTTEEISEEVQALIKAILED